MSFFLEAEALTPQDLEAEDYATFTAPFKTAYGVAAPLMPATSSELTEASRDRRLKLTKRCRDKLLAVSRKASRLSGKSALSDRGWAELLRDLMEVQSTVFPFLSVRACYADFVESLLGTGRFELAQALLTCLTHSGDLPSQSFILNGNTEAVSPDSSASVALAQVTMRAQCMCGLETKFVITILFV